MSNDVYGYVDSVEPSVREKLSQLLQTHAGNNRLGFTSIPREDVYGLPPELAPSEGAACFRVSDSPGKASASYLVDMVDYCADVGLPRSGQARLDMLLSWIEAVGTEPSVDRMVIAMSDGNEVEGVSLLEVQQLRARLHADFEACAPPNRAYVVTAMKKDRG